MYIVRAKKAEDGEWVRGYLWRGSNIAVIIPYNIGVDIDVKKHSLNAWATEVDPDTISRVIGLEDIKGNSLVEHQIVDATYGFERIRGVLSYSEDRALWQIEARLKGDLTSIDLVECYNIVAIGDVFDNAYLLDETDRVTPAEEEDKVKESESEMRYRYQEPYEYQGTEVNTSKVKPDLCELIDKFLATPGCEIIVVERRHK